MFGRRNGENTNEIIVLASELILTIFFIMIILLTNRSFELLLYLLILFMCTVGLSYFIFSVQRRRKQKAMEEYTSEAIRKISAGNGYMPKRKPGISELDDTLAELDQAYRRRTKNSKDILFIINAISSNTEISEMMRSILRCLLDSTKSNWGAFYLANNASGKLELKSSLGFDLGLYQEFDITIGEGLIGAAAKSDEIQIIKNLPEDTVFATKTFLGKVVPKNVMLIPILNNGLLLGMLSLASFYDYTSEECDAADLYKHYVAIALVNCVAFERTERARNEIFFQNNLIQDLNKELQHKVEDKNIFMKNIINSIKEYAIYVIDIKGRVLEWNNGAEVLYGYKESQAVGQNINLIYTDEEISSSKLQQRIDTVHSTGSFSDRGWKTKRDGTRFYADINVFGLYNEKNQIIGMTSVTKDITPTKYQQTEFYYREELLKTLMENEDRAVIASSEEGIIEYNDEYAKRFFKKEHTLGLDIFYLFKESEALRSAVSECSGSRIELQASAAETGAICQLKVKILKDDMLNYRKYIFVIHK